MKKRLAIIGSTGSIGTQALEVVRLNPDEFEITALAALKNADALEKQVREFNPSVAVLKDPPKDFVPEKSHVQWGFGSKARDEICELECVDSVLVCVVGMDGLSCVINAIKHRKQVLLANKETLMTGGDIVMSLAKEYSVEIIPVDSEHTAIYQCLKGERKYDVEKLLLTASGGPFRTWKKEDIYN
ncbi:MAG: 1-deoxy-D-xylulose-5-phosphate reductoisomerase, partial [Clostridia bacterium]|nr:1-deoxy-D-xylulose-5-phosphate reductoisomerase [Clostridia bacterium]